jgi:polar amino acid transport system ATP-binding protein
MDAPPPVGTDGLSPPPLVAPATVGVSATEICKAFGNHAALTDVTLDVGVGEVVSVIGPSGAGKTTLLRCINMLEVPTSGRVTVGSVALTVAGGRLQQPKSVLAELRRAVGMVFQAFNLFPHLTVLRNVAMPQERVLGRDRGEAESSSLALLERVGLKEKAHSYPGQCSGGQQQRVAIARALALKPAVMLFDEPTSALDPEVGAEILAIMRELAADGMTMLVATHEMSFAKEASDRIVVMVDGRIIEAGAPADVIDNPGHERTRRFLRAVLDR